MVLIVTSGTSRMDNKKVKALFGGKPKMLGLDEVAEITGHEVGGVCPFGLKTQLAVYCDVSMKAFDIGEPQASGKTYKVTGTLKQGISSETAKKITKLIRDDGPKNVKTQIQGDEVRVSSKKRDDLQAVIAMLKKADLDVALQFVNYR